MNTLFILLSKNTAEIKSISCFFSNYTIFILKLQITLKIVSINLMDKFFNKAQFLKLISMQFYMTYAIKRIYNYILKQGYVEFYF